MPEAPESPDTQVPSWSVFLCCSVTEAFLGSAEDSEGCERSPNKCAQKSQHKPVWGPKSLVNYELWTIMNYDAALAAVTLFHHIKSKLFFAN